jgi:hypothetical protein
MGMETSKLFVQRKYPVGPSGRLMLVRDMSPEDMESAAERLRLTVQINLAHAARLSELAAESRQRASSRRVRRRYKPEPPNASIR